MNEYGALHTVIASVAFAMGLDSPNFSAKFYTLAGESGFQFMSDNRHFKVCYLLYVHVFKEWRGALVEQAAHVWLGQHTYITAEVLQVDWSECFRLSKVCH